MHLSRATPPAEPVPGILSNCLRGIAIGLLTGLVVALFRVTHNFVFSLLMSWLRSAPGHWWIALLWFGALVCVAGAIGSLVLAVPLIPGSGIPQTELVLAGKLPVEPRQWPRVLAAKFAASWLAVTAGLSLGREGPCIQMGGAVGAMCGRMWGLTRLAGSAAVIGGAAAGLSAAFGAPLGGMLFAFEEMKSRRTREHLLVALAAAFSAQFVAKDIFGLGRLFPFAAFAPPPLSGFWIPACLGVLLGLLGCGYNAALLRVKDLEAGQTLLPARFRTLPPLAVAGILAFTVPAVLGGGDGLIARLGIDSLSLSALLGLLGLKMLFSIYSYTGSVAGGLLMPLLCIGALLGLLTGQELAAFGLIQAGYADSCIVFGMAGFFAAVVRAPLTGIALVIEMSGSTACLPGALVAALIASLTADALRCPPVYDSLKERIPLPQEPSPGKD